MSEDSASREDGRCTTHKQPEPPPEARRQQYRRFIGEVQREYDKVRIAHLTFLRWLGKGIRERCALPVPEDFLARVEMEGVLPQRHAQLALDIFTLWKEENFKEAVDGGLDTEDFQELARIIDPQHRDIMQKLRMYDRQRWRRYAGR